LPSQFLIRRAAAVINSGGVIAYPTEAVYGLGCDPDDPDAVVRLLSIKQRSLDHGLIVIAATIDQLENYLAPMSKSQRQKLVRSWPGPQTWVAPAADRAPVWLTGKHDTIAVRVTAHPVASALCRQCGHGLVSTSANLAGGPPARDVRKVRRALGDELDYILNGPVGGLAQPTPIRDLVTGKILRS